MAEAPAEAAVSTQLETAYALLARIRENDRDPPNRAVVTLAGVLGQLGDPNKLALRLLEHDATLYNDSDDDDRHAFNELAYAKLCGVLVEIRAFLDAQA